MMDEKLGLAMMDEKLGLARMVEKRENEARKLNLRSLQIQKELDWIKQYGAKKDFNIDVQSKNEQSFAQPWADLRQMSRPFPAMSNRRIPPHPQYGLPQSSRSLNASSPNFGGPVMTMEQFQALQREQSSRSLNPQQGLAFSNSSAPMFLKQIEEFNREQSAKFAGQNPTFDNFGAPMMIPKQFENFQREQSANASSQNPNLPNFGAPMMTPEQFEAFQREQSANAGSQNPNLPNFGAPMMTPEQFEAFQREQSANAAPQQAQFPNRFAEKAKQAAHFQGLNLGKGVIEALKRVEARAASMDSLFQEKCAPMDANRFEPYQNLSFTEMAQQPPQGFEAAPEKGPEYSGPFGFTAAAAPEKSSAYPGAFGFSADKPVAEKSDN